MAKRRSAAARTVRTARVGTSGPTTIKVQVPRAAQPAVRKVRRAHRRVTSIARKGGVHVNVILAGGAAGLMAEKLALPKVMDSLGEVGNLGIYAYVASAYFNVPYAGDMATACGTIALYEIMRGRSIEGVGEEASGIAGST